MDGRGLWRMFALLAGSAMLLAACQSTKKPLELSEGFKHTLEEMEQRSGEMMRENLAKQLVPPGETPERRATMHMLLPGEPIWIQSGKSRALQLPNRIVRVSLADPDIAGILVLGPQSIMINAHPLPKEEKQRHAMTVGRTGTVLGETLTPEPRLSETTLVIWTADNQPETHTLIVADFIDQQILLEVTVAEIDRTAMEQHGLDFRIIRDNLIAAGFMAGGVPVPFQIPPEQGQTLLPLGGGIGGTPTYVFSFPDQDVTLFVKALETEGLATILAQPKILAMSGQIAVFQVGGEIPIRVSSGFTADIEFKPFGTLVNFIPRVTEDGDILLTVTPEVSEPDFSLTVEGIPSFRTRRASTSAKLRAGQTLILGGLLQKVRTEQVSGFPYLKDVPFLGYAFRSTTYQTDIRELLVTVKPTMVRPIDVGQEVTIPAQRGPLTRGEARTKPDPAEATRPRIPLLP